ncbi:MAG TPA: prepilin-type N-terminal cleavage/methylation domain-containing protein [Candidatus Saccharimonadales bacterium]|nr:prepilin-type N-terminal cleavage/methylation domain-containing protein [Candidatus Saccharimonadales bacterium]
MNTQQKEKGFTIIEVVLVLAIAGLIFLMVFIALPALQRSQRDSARQKDVTTVASAVTTYTNVNRGSFPSTASLASYVEEVSENTLEVTVATTTGAQTILVDDGDIVVARGAKCGESSKNDSEQGKQLLEKGNSRQYVVITRLEAGGGVAYCLDN